MQPILAPLPTPAKTPNHGYITKPPDESWKEKKRTCLNCFEKFLPETWWQKFCKVECRLEFNRTGQVSVEKFRHYIDSKVRQRVQELIARIGTLAAAVEKLSQKLDEKNEQLAGRVKDLEEFRRRQQLPPL